MLTYLSKRLGMMIPLLIGITFISFLIMHLILLIAVYCTHQNGAGDGRIQRIDLAAHRQFDEEVAAFAHQTPHAFAFIAHY